MNSRVLEHGGEKQRELGLGSGFIPKRRLVTGDNNIVLVLSRGFGAQKRLFAQHRVGGGEIIAHVVDVAALVKLDALSLPLVQPPVDFRAQAFERSRARDERRQKLGARGKIALVERREHDGRHAFDNSRAVLYHPHGDCTVAAFVLRRGEQRRNDIAGLETQRALPRQSCFRRVRQKEFGRGGYLHPSVLYRRFAEVFDVKSVYRRRARAQHVIADRRSAVNFQPDVVFRSFFACHLYLS